jgi:hypothetical protein
MHFEDQRLEIHNQRGVKKVFGVEVALEHSQHHADNRWLIGVIYIGQRPTYPHEPQDQRRKHNANDNDNNHGHFG